jgi:hypothetical protein
MRPMCAVWAFEWRFELASVFALFREHCFQKDTIPKPGGLGSGGPLSGLSVPVLSHICPIFVPVLSRFSAGSVYALERRWNTSFTTS